MLRPRGRLKTLWDHATDGNSTDLQECLHLFPTPAERIEALKYTNGYLQNTCLHQASMNGHTATVGVLVEYGSVIDAVNENNDTPLYVATHKGHFNVVDMLLRVGADVSHANMEGRHPLHIACIHEDLAMVQHLLGNGADVSARDRYDRTPLLIAVRRGNMELARVLLDNNADMTVIDNTGTTVHSEATSHANFHMLNMLTAEHTRRVGMQQQRHLAFAMGMHHAIGNESLVVQFDEEIIHMILERS
jgi:ankyrin repeat protein